MAKRLDEEPVYYISVAARLVEVHPQTLRMYERLGLVRPSRSDANMRLYSQRDIQHLCQIQRLTQERGVNLAGVREILVLLGKMDAMRQEMEREMDEMQREMEREIERLQRQQAKKTARRKARNKA